MIDIVLTTYPALLSMNVGDSLITESAIKLVKARLPEYKPTVFFRERSLDGFKKIAVLRVIAPGFSVADDVYPRLYALFSDLDRLKSFWPVGCAYQSPLTPQRSFQEPYSQETLKFLMLITSRFGSLPCRDQLIVERLRRFDLPAHYIGDLALFDEDLIGTKARVGKELSSFVITVPHHLHYVEQTIDLAKRLARAFPKAKRYVSLHSRPSRHAQVTQQRLAQLGYTALDLFGESSNLKAYEDIDLHVGYRLHGHIHFLRNRKPSILMVEDTRAYGVSRTEGTALGCIDAFDESQAEPLDDAPATAMRFLHEQLESGFSDFEKVFAFIDRTFADVVAPYFDNLARDFTTSNPPPN